MDGLDALRRREPSASGIGGGAILLLAGAGGVRAFEGISAAPSRVTDRLTRDFDGRTIPADRVTFGGRTVGVPGALRALELAHRAAGRLPWARLFAPAVEAAEAGVPVSPHLTAKLGEAPLMRGETLASTLWCAGGRVLPVGSVFRNPALAATLRLIAEGGADAFYSGPLAERIVAAAAADLFPGTLSLADLAAYRAVERAPVRFAFNGWQVVTGPPPAMGGTAVGQILGMAARLGVTTLPETPTKEVLHVLAECGRVARADRAIFGDPEAMTHAPEAALDGAYLDTRARLIDRRRVAPSYMPGLGPEAADRTLGGSMTSHLAIADGFGNVVSMTTTINKNFGSNVSVGGFYLNDVMTNFSDPPTQSGVVLANALAPGRRPRTTFAPTLVLDAAGRVIAAIGAGGGHRIIGFVANFLLRLAGGERDPQAMLGAPHALNWHGITEVETAWSAQAAALAADGHYVIRRRMDAGAQALVFADDQVLAGADPRRDGMAMAAW